MEQKAATERKTKAVAAALAAALLTGCATAPGGAQYVPLIDIKPEQGANYSADLTDCQAYAERAVGAGAGAAGGAVAGALAMGILSAVLGGGGHGRWAAVGALSGAASGAAAGETNQRDVIRRCMDGRGYSVLN